MGDGCSKMILADLLEALSDKDKNAPVVLVLNEFLVGKSQGLVQHKTNIERVQVTEDGITLSGSVTLNNIDVGASVIKPMRTSVHN